MRQGLFNDTVSVCPCVCPILHRSRGELSSTAFSSKCEQCYIYSWRRRANADLLSVIPNIHSSRFGSVICDRQIAHHKFACSLKACSQQRNWTEQTWRSWPSYTTRYWSRASVSRNWLAAVWFSSSAVTTPLVSKQWRKCSYSTACLYHTIRSTLVTVQSVIPRPAVLASLLEEITSCFLPSFAVATLLRKLAYHNGITQCYLPPDRGDILAFTPAKIFTRFSDPGGMPGWLDLIVWVHNEMIYPPEVACLPLALPHWLVDLGFF